jgi:hypothetical protein
LLNTEILHTWNIRELDLESKTGDITNMIDDMQSNRLKNAVADLHLQSLQNELIAANNAFDAEPGSPRHIREMRLHH